LVLHSTPRLIRSQVTIEIDSDPPAMKNPSGLQPPEEGDTVKGHIHKTFELPASLLE
jgi:D-tyrosyl-tRNA(Tyr) deacylase